jgi:tetratricopeptide (TPR) repeat protein
MIDKASYKRPAKYGLRVVKGFSAGKTYPLYQGQDQIIGKASDCHITIESMSAKISFKHANLREDKGRFFIDNLSQTAELRIGGKKNIKSVEVKKGQRITIGDHQFTLVPFEALFAAPGSSRILKILLFTGIGLILFTLFTIMLSDDPQPEKRPENPISAPLTERPTDDPTLRQVQPGDDLPEVKEKEKEAAVSPEKIRTSEDLYRQGLFHYESTNYRKAIQAWEQALVHNPAHANASDRLKRTRDELKALVKEYLANAELQVRLMKTEEARKLFEIVLELVPDENDSRHIEAAQKLDALDGG